MAATLLLADESITVQRVAELTLAREGIRVIAVGDGEEALRHLETDRPDIVLVDVGLPTIDGYGVASRVRESPGTRHVPVLLLIGPFDPIDKVKAQAAGCDGVLVKPFELEQLVGCVKDLLAGRRPASLWKTDVSLADTSTEPTVKQPPTAAAGPPRVVEAPAASEWFATPHEQPVGSVAPAAPAPAEPKVDAAFDFALEQLDKAFASSMLPTTLDDSTSKAFAKDVGESRGIDVDALAAYRAQFGDWEVPVPRTPDESASQVGGTLLAQPTPLIPQSEPPRPPAPARRAPVVRARSAKSASATSLPPAERTTVQAPVPVKPRDTAAQGGAVRAAAPPSRGPVRRILDSPDSRMPVFPWQHRPFTVAKLRDVMTLDTRHFARLPKVLTALEEQLRNGKGVLPIGLKAKIRKGLTGPLTECREVGFVSSAKCIGRIQARLDATNCTAEQIAELFSDFGRRLEDDAELCTALLIPSSTADLYTSPQKGWKQVLDRFPSLTVEIEEANKCLAVGRFAATVFHLSRVMDAGLGALGRSLKLQRKHAPTWTAVLAAIDKKVVKADVGRKGPPRSRQEVREEKFLAKAADYLRAVQDAWRSPDMHEIRHVYDNQTAHEVLTAVQTFMRHLATRVDG